MPTLSDAQSRAPPGAEGFLFVLTSCMLVPCLAASHHFFGLLPSSHNSFVMNTYRSVSKQRLLTLLESALTQKGGEGGVLLTKFLGSPFSLPLHFAASLFRIFRSASFLH